MKVELVEDIPLLLAKFAEVGLKDLLDEHLKTHGNWKGPSLGQTTVLWMSCILSCGDHRLCKVEDWATQRLHTLQGCIGDKSLRANHLSDDRLESILDYISGDKWDTFEIALNKCLINVFSLGSPQGDQVVRFDTTIAQSHRQPGVLFQVGHSKQRRQDLPQIKTMISTLDPLALPLHAQVVSGNSADDPLYIPAISQIEKTLSVKGCLLVGDTKMGSLETRAHIQGKEAYYLMPLAKKHCSEEQIRTYLASKPEYPLEIREEQVSGESILKAKLFEVETTEVSYGEQKWNERRIIAHTVAYAEAQKASLNKRIAKVELELAELFTTKQGKRQPKSYQEAVALVQVVLAKHKVEDFMAAEVMEQEQKATKRKYGQRPTLERTTLSYSVKCKIMKEALDAHIELLGWRVYATNAPIDRLTPEQVVQLYWQEYRIEQRFNDLINKITALMPILLHKENRVEALVKLLMLALKFTTLIQHQARAELKKSGQFIKELYPGNPGRKTQDPTTKLILGAFEGIALVILPLPDGSKIVQMTPLKPPQVKLLSLLGLSETTYEAVTQFWKTP